MEFPAVVIKASKVGCGLKFIGGGGTFSEQLLGPQCDGADRDLAGAIIKWTADGQGGVAATVLAPGARR